MFTLLKLSAQIEEFAKVMAGTSTGTTPMAVSFDRLAQAIRRQFYKVDKDLKEQAERDPDFGAALANQRAFVQQSASWRIMSRLPHLQQP